MPTIQTVFSRAPARPTALPGARRGGILATAATAIAVTLLVAVTADAGMAAPANGRVWELVTPPDPSGAPVSVVSAIGAAGDRVGYATIGVPPGAQAGSLFTSSIAWRTSHGWSGVPTMPRYSISAVTFQPPMPIAANEDMSRWIWQSTHPLTPDAPPSPTLSLYSSGIDGVPTLLPGVGVNFELAGASADARRLVFRTGTQLLPHDVRTSGRQVYELTDAGLRLVGVDSDGVPLSACGAIAGSDTLPPNAVSRDARRVFVSSPDTANCGTSRRIYLREDGETTIEISASRCARPSPPCNAAADVRFMGATPSGSVAFLATAQQLTDDDLDDGQDLYRYDVASDTLSRVSVGPPGVVAGVTTSAAHASDDGSRVYFIASGVLVPGEGVAGAPNIYVSDDDGLRFVATIASTDSWQTATSPAFRRDDVQLTPDGSHLVFMSTAALTADDTDASKDIYLYDAEEDTLSRVSGIGGSGNGAFDADLTRSPIAFLFSTVPAVAGYPLRSLSDDGRVFFRTEEALIDDDVNTTTDVYEWSDGTLALITSGLPSGSVRYHTASADGSSVFFTTDESLVDDDDDQGDPDLYVAREGGGFPARAQPPSPACPGDNCAPESGGRLRRPVPASVGFVDPKAVPPRRFRIHPISHDARRRMAARGSLRLRIQTATSGRIVVRARARLGNRTRTVARGRVRAARGGTVQVRLRLSPRARRRLREGRTLLVRLEARRSRPNRSASVLLKLERRR